MTEQKKEQLEFSNILLIGEPPSDKNLWFENLLELDEEREIKPQYIVISANKDSSKNFLDIKRKQEYKIESMNFEKESSVSKAISFIDEQNDNPYLLILNKKKLESEIDNPNEKPIKELLNKLSLQKTREENGIPLYIIMDEFQTLGSIENIEKFISNNNLNMNFVLSIQTKSLLQAVYDDETAQEILDHTHHKCF